MTISKTKNSSVSVSIDDKLLEIIEKWRAILATVIAGANLEMKEDQLGRTVSRIVAGIVFLRVCEERGLEKRNSLLEIKKSAKTFKSLLSLFEYARGRYGFDQFDDSSLHSASIEDEILRGFIGDIYAPQCSFDFSLVTSDILGRAYERFLGKTIKLDEKRVAHVEPKPDVKKAGGVFYTPAYIVDEIVRGVLDPLLEGKNPAQAKKLKICDPACGGGSFLIGAYRYLLTWHVNWYAKNDKVAHKNLVYTDDRGQEQLDIESRKKILSACIFGVDIDPEAVTTTRLALILNTLEGKQSFRENKQLDLFVEHVLPTLDMNIKCGNSLIGPEQLSGSKVGDTYCGKNLFGWSQEFPTVFGGPKPGFDAIIGNPPYIRIQSMVEWAPNEVEIYKSAYETASKGNYDLYVIFVEQGIRLLNGEGLLGYILPHKFFTAKYGAPLRKLLSFGKRVSRIVHFGDSQVFAGASTYTCLLFCEKGGCEKACVTMVRDLDEWRAGEPQPTGEIHSDKIRESEWSFKVDEGSDLFEKLERIPTKLSDVVARIAQGIRTSANDVYVLDVLRENGKELTCRSDFLDREVILERACLVPFLRGRDIKAYSTSPSGKSVLIPYENQGDKPTLLPIEAIRDRFPLTHAYLLACRNRLEGRENGRMQGDGWHGFVYPKNIELMQSAKLLVPDMADRASFADDPGGTFAFTSGYGLTFKDSVKESPLYFLGLLNSAVLDFYIRTVSTPMRGGFFRYFGQYMETMPIKRIDFTSADDIKRHDGLVDKVRQILALRSAGRPSGELSKKIDHLVFDLYNLTEEEAVLLCSRPPLD